MQTQENSSLKSISITSIVVLVTMIFAWTIMPAPQVTKGKVYDDAAAWCQFRISELPPGDGNRKVFEQALEDISKRNIRWSIDDPSGLHYKLLVDFADAWQYRPNKGVAPAPSVSNAEENASQSENRPQIPPEVFPHNVVRDGGEVVITYGHFNRRPLQMVFDQKSSRVIVRVDVTRDNDHKLGVTGDQVFQFLKSEVERLVATNSPVQLGTSGVTLKFNGKFPIWGPHRSCHGMRNEFYCILFAEHATFENEEIRAWGMDSKIPYYPYNLTASK